MEIFQQYNTCSLRMHHPVKTGKHDRPKSENIQDGPMGYEHIVGPTEDLTGILYKRSIFLFFKACE